MAAPLYLTGSLTKLGQTRNPDPGFNNRVDLSPNREPSYYQPKTKGQTPATTINILKNEKNAFQVKDN